MRRVWWQDVLWGFWNGISASMLLIAHVFDAGDRFSFYGGERSGNWYDIGFLLGTGSPFLGIFGAGHEGSRRCGPVIDDGRTTVSPAAADRVKATSESVAERPLVTNTPQTYTDANLRFDLAGVYRLLSDDVFRGLLDSAPDGILVVGPDGKIVVANTEMERLFGYDRAELIGASPDMLVPDDVRAQHAGHRSRYEHTPSSRPMGIGMTLRGRRKDGSAFPVEISLSPRQTADGVLIMAAIRDISERLRLEAERSTLLEAAQAQTERERIAMDLHDGVIQSIFGVGLGLEIAAEEARGTPAEEMIDRSIDQLNDVIRDIRAYIFELRPMAYEGDLVDSLQHLAGVFRASSPITIEVELDAGLTCTDDAVAVAVFQIAQEALANVRKHSQAKHAHLTLESSDGAIRTRISDDGVGFDPAAERTDEHRGLRNMRNRADSIGGRIEIESDAGHGTTISLVVPYES